MAKEDITRFYLLILYFFSFSFFMLYIFFPFQHSSKMKSFIFEQGSKQFTLKLLFYHFKVFFNFLSKKTQN